MSLFDIKSDNTHKSELAEHTESYRKVMDVEIEWNIFIIT